MPTPRRVRLVGAAATAAVLTAGCGGSEPGSGGAGGGGGGERVDGRPFTMALAVDPGNLDPSMSASTAARQIFGLAYDSIVYAKEDGSFAPGLAESWTSTPNSVTFTLKKGVTCSDGTALTATDVAENVDYIAEPKNGSPLLGVLVQPGTRTTADDAKGVVTVTTPKPDGLLLAELSGLFILCRAGLDDHASVEKGASGSGPYTLEEALPGDHYTFAPREEYAWGPDGQTMEGVGVPESVTVRVIDNQTTIANLLRSGELNLATVAGPDAARVPEGLDSIESTNTAGEVWFNEGAGHPGADPAVREALVTAVDRKALSDVATGGSGQPSTGLITLPPNPCLEADPVGPNLPDHDPARAAEILDEAGWVPGEGGVRAKGGKDLALKVSFTGTGQATRVAGMELLASYWEELGVKVDLQNLPDAQLSEELFSTGAWDVTATPFTFNLPSQLVGFVSGPAAPEGANFANIQNEDYTAAVAKAGPLVGEESCPEWSKAEEALVKAHNPAPLFDDVVRTFYDKAELTAPGVQIWGSSIRMLNG